MKVSVTLVIAISTLLLIINSCKVRIIPTSKRYEKLSCACNEVFKSFDRIEAQIANKEEDDTLFTLPKVHYRSIGQREALLKASKDFAQIHKCLGHTFFTDTSKYILLSEWKKELEKTCESTD